MNIYRIFPSIYVTYKNKNERYYISDNSVQQFIYIKIIFMLLRKEVHTKSIVILQAIFFKK